MRILKKTNKYKKSLQKLFKDSTFGKKVKQCIDDVESQILSGQIDDKYDNHSLVKNKAKKWGVHLCGKKIVLMYSFTSTEVLLEDIGTHKDVLNIENYNIIK